MLTDFFDTMGTMIAVGTEGGMLDDDGLPPSAARILAVDAAAAAAAGAASVSTNTAYVESVAGVAEGARTDWPASSPEPCSCLRPCSPPWSR
jgi:adenine/guanine/hypoxanthine permease